ncbi:MAG: ABC transporter permease [Prevotellaceae bacterium]|jgi:putative ABC transport system permease protein|nr:ABC transporter permease [Prevotellaceae bacterium]
MRIDLDSTEEILLTITRNKTRSLLTAFGVFWGIFMLVTLVGAGNGWQTELRQQFEGFATNSAFVYSDRTSVPYKGFRKGRWWSLELQDIERLRRSVDEIDIITPSISYWGRTVVREEQTYDASVQGLYPEYQKIEAPNITVGRYINDVDISEARKVCVIGSRVYESLFKRGEDPCGQTIRIDGTYYTVIGVNYAEGNISIQGEASESIIMPYTTMQQAYNIGQRIDIACMVMKPGVKVTAIEDKVKGVLKEAHYIAPDDKQAVGMLNAEAMFSMIDNLMLGVRVLFWMVGLGTLFAGAIGVSNIMMVTVKERTTEIGIRRAIGARPRDILQQILSESMVLTIIAGMAGISFAVLVLQVFEAAVNDPGTITTPYQVSFWTAIGMGALLVALGMLAGLAPAYRAMGIKPIEAIRDE